MSTLRSLALGIAAAAGIATGWLLAQRYLERHRAALFSPKVRRRHAALGYLVGHPDSESLRVLRDYLAWERHPLLRRRAARVVRELEHVLG